MSPREQFVETWLPYLAALAASLLVAAVAFGIVVLAAGGGHGSYFPAKLLFPIPMICTLLTGSISPPVLFLAAAQWPIYAVVLLRAGRRARLSSAATMVAAVHAGAALLALAMLRGGSFDP